MALTEDHGTDRLFEVQREAERAVLELEQFVDGRVGQTRDTGDAVADLEDAPTWEIDMSGLKPSRFRLRTSAMSAVLIVSSAIGFLA